MPPEPIRPEECATIRRPASNQIAAPIEFGRSLNGIDRALIPEKQNRCRHPRRRKCLPIGRCDQVMKPRALVQYALLTLESKRERTSLSPINIQTDFPSPDHTPSYPCNGASASRTTGVTAAFFTSTMYSSRRLFRHCR